MVKKRQERQAFMTGIKETNLQQQSTEDVIEKSEFIID